MVAKLDGGKYWSLSEKEREQLIAFVHNNIIKSKPISKDRANGEEFQPGVRVFIHWR